MTHILNFVVFKQQNFTSSSIIDPDIAKEHRDVAYKAEVIKAIGSELKRKMKIVGIVIWNITNYEVISISLFLIKFNF